MRNLKQKSRRICLIVLGLLVIAGAGALGWNTWVRPQEKVKEIAAYQYQETANINYRVYLLPNELFAEPSLGPGKFYLASLTDRIDTFFSYKFTGQEAADYSGTYMVKGYISASNDESKDSIEKQEIWRKDLTFVPLTSFSGHGKDVVLNKQVSIPYQSYKVFTEQVKDITKFAPSAVNLNVDYIVSLNSKTSKGPLQENITSSMIIPLDSSAFMVKGQLQQDKSDALKTKVSIPAPGVKVLQVILFVFTFLILLFFLFILLFTRGEKEFITPAEKECQQLLKKHGNRIIIIKNLPRNLADQILTLESFDDLLKAADDLGQPILLEDPGTDQYLFYVRDGLLLYQYLLSKPLADSFYDEFDSDTPVT